MAENPWARYRFFALSLAITAVALLGLVFILRRPEAPVSVTMITSTPRPSLTPPKILVDVRGAVVKPGDYMLAKGSRVQDALDAAGGVTSDANLDKLNLAKILSDGEQVLVPTRTASSASPNPTRANETPGAASSPVASATPGKLNINTASLAELDKLPGIGPVTAQKIIDYRQTNGVFKKVEDIRNVSGIGDKVFDQIKDLITVQ